MKSGNPLVLMILVSSLLSAAFPIQSALGSEVFSDDFETGDMSLWTGHSGSGTVDVISSLKHHGAYSANFSVGFPDEAICYWKDLGSSGYTDLFFRCSVCFFALPTSGYTMQLFALCGTLADQRVMVAISYDGVSYYWRLQAPSSDLGSPSTIELNTWYSIEIERKQGVGTGAAKLWVDGTLLLETNTLTIDHNSRYPNVGITFTNLTTVVVYDCCEVNTAYIGEDNILFSDGFESGDDNEWSSSYWAHSINTTMVHSGTHSLRLGPSLGYVERNITSSTTIYYRWYTYLQNLSFNNGEYVQLSRVRGSDNTPVTGIYIDYSVDHYRLELQWAHPSLGIVHHDYPFVANAWYCFEEKIVIGTSGEFRVWVNGVEEITQTGLDTSKANDCRYFMLGYVSWNNSVRWNGYIFLDDAVISRSHVQAIISETNPYIANMLSDVQESEIYASVSHLQNFTTREYGTTGNFDAGTYLYNRLSAIPRLDVEFQSSYRNIIATLNGTDPATNAIYIVGAHYDSTSSDQNNAPGATDNGGGIAIVLELARIMSRYEFRHTLKFGLWNCEEGGSIGSQEYAQYALANGLNVSLYFNYDSSCYDPDNRMVLDIMYRSKSILVKNLMTQHNTLYGIGFTLTYNAWSCSSDHVPFWEKGYAAVMTHTETHGTQYHTSNDTVDKISPPYAKKNGQLGMSVLARLAEVKSLIGDINADYAVDAQDLHLLNEAYGATPSDTNWNMSSDLNNDTLVNVRDLWILAKNYG